MANVKISNLSTVWTSSASEFDAIKMVVTDSASSGSSKLLNLVLGSTTKFSVRKDGAVVGSGFTGTFTGSVEGTASRATTSSFSNVSSIAVSSSYSLTSSFAGFTPSSSRSELSNQAASSTSASFAESTQFAEYSATSGHSSTATSASYTSVAGTSLTSVSASYGAVSTTSSHAVSALSSSYALNGGSLATGSSHNITASWSATSSFSLSTSTVPHLGSGSYYNITSSWASNVVSSSYASVAHSSSHAITASYAERYAPYWPSNAEISGSGLIPSANNVVNYVATSASFSLFVNSLGNTPQYFKWYINSSSLLQAGTSSVYNVTSSRKNPNSGIYTCQVTNSYGTATSPNFQVQVLDPVELVSETPPDSTPSVNSMVYFIVSATGDLIRYRWKKRGTTPALDVYVVDGQPSILNEGYQSSTLSIQAISPASEGSYFCEISNSISNTSSSNMLIYVTAPTIVTQPSDVDSFGVSSVVATGSAISYSWEYNGVPITDQTSSSLNLSVAVNENNFTQTMMDQLSTLKCKVYNQVGYNYSNTIQVKPFKNSSAASPTGGGAATRCDNSFNAINATVQLVAPIGTTYTVYKNGTNVGSDLTEFGETMPKLTLHNVQFSDAGTYCVSASFNGKSVVSDSTTVTVAVNNVSHNVPNPVKYVFSDESHTLVADYGMSMGNLISTSPPAGNYRLDSAWRRSGVSTTYDQTTVLAEVPCPGPGGFADVPTFYAGTLDMLGGNIVGSGLTSSHAGGATYYFQYAIGVVYSSCPTNSLVNPNPWPYLPNPDTMVPTGEYGPGYPLNGTTLLQSIVMVQGPVGISTHPSGSQTRNTGSAVVFRTVGNSSGSSIHYRWYKNGTRIPESDTSTYTISNCAIADAGTYTCLVGAKSLLSYRTMLSSGSVLTVI